MTSKQIICSILMITCAGAFAFGAATVKRPATSDTSTQASKKPVQSTQKASSAAQQAPQGANVAISFAFDRANKKGSDQFAIWIEDAQGKLVRTVFVTNYTVKKGAAKTTDCLPLWSEKSGIRSNAKAADAVTGATPAKGTQTYYWDLTDQSNAKVQPGTYKIFVEGTQSPNEQIVLQSTINVGGDRVEINLQPTGDMPANPMLSSVKLVYQP